MLRLAKERVASKWQCPARWITAEIGKLPRKIKCWHSIKIRRTSLRTELTDEARLAGYQQKKKLSHWYGRRQQCAKHCLRRFTKRSLSKYFCWSAKYVFSHTNFLYLVLKQISTGNPTLKILQIFWILGK